MDRREFVATTMTAVAAAYLARTAAAEGVLKRSASNDVRRWVSAHAEIAQQLHDGRITGPQWQSEVERLARRVDVQHLLDQIDFTTIERTIDLHEPGGTKKFVRLPHPDDPAREITFGAAVFGLRQNYAITPHAHRNMVSAHMVIKGELHVRNFDRLGDDESHVIVTPTVDKTIRRGDVSTMSTEKNNVHWFTAKTPSAFTLDIDVDGLVPTEKEFVIELLDVRNADRLSNGALRAKIIDWKESVRLYGIES